MADDYQDLRELLSRVLRDAGFVVRTAANGLEPLILAHETRPSVIVMDVSMPVLGDSKRPATTCHTARDRIHGNLNTR
jgi:CheY-like chemotaxis protein